MRITQGHALEEIGQIAYSIGAWCAAGMLPDTQGLQAVLLLTPQGDTPYREAALGRFEEGQHHWEQFA